MSNRRQVLAAACMMVAACGVDTASTSSTAAALEVAQCDFGTFDGAASACRSTYEACIAVEGADVEACRVALRACLPTPPDRGGGGCEGMDGGRGHGGPGEHGGPPPGDRPDGGFGRGGPGGRGGHGGPGGRGPHPDPAAVQACRDALTACQAADATDTTCEETEHTCVRTAFEAAFAAACTEATTQCAGDTSEPCTRILERCAAGVGGTNSTCSSAVVE